MADTDNNVTNDRLDMALDDIIKDSNKDKSKGKGKRSFNRERKSVKNTSSRLSTKSSGIRKKAFSDTSRAQAVNKARGIASTVSPAQTRRAATSRARTIARRAIQRRQTPTSTPRITLRRRLNNNSNITSNNTTNNTKNLKVTIGNDRANSSRSNTTGFGNSGNNGNSGGQLNRWRSLVRSNLRDVIVNRRASSRIGNRMSSRLGNRRDSGRILIGSRNNGRRLSVKPNPLDRIQPRRARVIQFTQQRDLLRSNQIDQIRGIQRQAQNVERLSLNERFGGNARNNRNNNNNNNNRNNGGRFVSLGGNGGNGGNRGSRGSRGNRNGNESGARGRGGFRFQQPDFDDSFGGGSKITFNNDNNNNRRRRGGGGGRRFENPLMRW